MEREPLQSESRRPFDHILVIGPGPKFLSGIAYHTAAIVRSFDRAGLTVSAILVRNLCPKWLYPGRSHVGTVRTSDLGYGMVPVSEGLDWYWLPSLWADLRFLRQRRPEVVLVQWWSVVTAHTWLVLVWAAHRQGATVLFEMHETNDPSEARVPLIGRWSRRAVRMMAKAIDGVVIHSGEDHLDVKASFPALANKPVSVVIPAALEHGARLPSQMPPG